MGYLFNNSVPTIDDDTPGCPCEDNCGSAGLTPTVSGDLLASRRINTDSPLMGGGDLTQDRTLSIQEAGATQDGYMSAADWLLLHSGSNSSFRILSGSATWSGVGLIFDITACTYLINGTLYMSAPGQIDLGPSDPDDPRIDVIYLNTSSVFGKLTGVHAPSPSKPEVDTTTQIELTFVNIAAGSTTPAGITEVIVYDEHVEWTGSASLGPLSFDYTAEAPYTGAKSIHAPLNAGYKMGFIDEIDAGVDTANLRYLKFALKQAEGIAMVDDALRYSVVLVVNNAGVETVINIGSVYDGTFGYNQSSVDWQIVAIPWLLDNTGKVTKVIFFSNSRVETQIDRIVLQSVTDGSVPGSGTGNAGNIYHAQSSSFSDANSLDYAPFIGQNLAIFYNGINRYLESDEWEHSLTGIKILLPGFDGPADARTSLFIHTKMIEI